MSAARADAQAETASLPLQVDEVLAASATHFPSILEALARRRGAEGDALASQGAFDLVFSVDGFDRVGGFYSGRTVESKVEQRLRPLGARIYGGYSISDGDFPIYEDQYFTNTGGEAKVGAILSLLRDRSIDKERFNVIDARLALRQADFDVLLTRVGVQHKALLAYWRWVAAGRQLTVYERLSRIARDRQAGLEEQVERGARAAIFLTENRQNITRRERLVAEAARDFDIAANNLSFYYRGANGEPVIPGRDRLPPDGVLDASEAEVAIGRAEPVAEALADRPELEILRTAQERARRKVALSENDLKPRLDVNAELSSDFGDVAEGGISRDSTDAVVGLRFSVPLQRRDAKGRLARARAELEAVEQQRRRARDEIELEIRNILVNLATSARIARIAEQETTQAEAMENAERQRFASGASDFFLVNVREETTADARIRELLAQLEIRLARANYDASTVDLERLGIADAAAIAPPAASVAEWPEPAR
ncbi:MAG: multidrug transporter [Alphaproteobacteria bacterium]|nr:multidrug transporter [Alphaproteobacteria bacterium]